MQYSSLFVYLCIICNPQKGKELLTPSRGVSSPCFVGNMDSPLLITHAILADAVVHEPRHQHAACTPDFSGATWSETYLLPVAALPEAAI